MKYNRIAILLLILGIAAASGQEMGSISITSQPDGCWIRVDSVLVGKTPLMQFELSPGRHSVEVYPPAKNIWNLQQRRFDIEVKSHQDTTIAVVFSNPIFINSVPYGAGLYRDSTLLGNTPLYIPFEENRGNTFRLVKQGYKPYRFNLSENNSILAHLEKDDEYQEKKRKPQLLGVIPKRHLKSKFSLLALTVASHWASFYLKNVADSNYQKYRQASDPRRMEQFWDKTQKYDRLSEISLGISYASLAGLIYLVIWK